MMWSRIVIAVLAGCATVAAGACAEEARAANLRPFQTPLERLIDDARAARVAGELDRAEALLDHAEAAAGRPDGRVLYERGLVAMQRDRVEPALDFLRRSAELDPSGDARVELAAILVGLGRWPEAVVMLRKAFDERGASLTADAVLADKRFGTLVGFGPFKDLIESVRNEENSVLGKLRSRLERMESLARTLEDMLVRLIRVVGALAELATAPWTAVALLVLIVFVIAAGIGQMRILPAPWTLVVSYPVAGWMWHAIAQIVTGGDSDGASTVLWAGLVVLGPASLGVAVRAVGALRRRRRGAPPASASEERRATSGPNLRPVPKAESADAGLRVE